MHGHLYKKNRQIVEVLFSHLYVCMYFMLTYLRNGFGESDPDVGLAANSNSRSGVFGCSFSSWSFSSSSSSKDLNFGTIGVLSRPGSG